MCQFYSEMHETSKRLCEICFRSILLHHLFGSLQDPAHLAAAEELLSLPRLLAPKQQHVVCRPHLSLGEMSYLYSEWSCELRVSSRCLRIEACDEVCVILVQSDGGAEVRLRLLRLGLGHAQLKLSPLLGAEIMTISVISIGVSCEQSSCSA